MSKEMKTKGFFWHVHHDRLVEWSDDIRERIYYIKQHKDKSEVPLRLKLLKPVKGKLPDEVAKAGKAYYKAKEAYVKAEEAYDKAGKAYYKAWEAHDMAEEVYYKAWEALDKADKAYYKAKEAYYKALYNHKSKLEALHRLECPNCPWDGYTIFPKGDA